MGKKTRIDIQKSEQKRPRTVRISTQVKKAWLKHINILVDKHINPVLNAFWLQEGVGGCIALYADKKYNS